MKLQTARQGRNEGPMEFAGRCKELAQRVMSKVNNPIAKLIIRENAARMCVARFVTSLSWVVGCQVRYAHPKSLREAVNLALAMDEAEKKERRNQTCYTGSDESAGQLPRSPGNSRRGRNNSEKNS